MFFLLIKYNEMVNKAANPSCSDFTESGGMFVAQALCLIVCGRGPSYSDDPDDKRRWNASDNFGSGLSGLGGLL